MNGFLSFNEKEITLLEKERLDDLCLDNLKIIQNSELYAFTSDAVILANSVKAKKTDTVIDLCSGSGIIGILVSHKTKCKKVICVEIQEQLAKMSAKSVKLCGKEDKISILNCRVQDCLEFIERESADVIVCNPPYKKKGTSFHNLTESVAIARHEKEITLNEIVENANRLLKFGGKFFICCDADRTAELIYYLKKEKLEPKEISFKFPSGKERASLVVTMAVKGGKEGVKILNINDKIQNTN